MDWRRFLPVRTAFLALAGLACFVIAAYLIYLPAAWIVAGLGLWLVEWLTRPDSEQRR